MAVRRTIFTSIVLLVALAATACGDDSKTETTGSVDDAQTSTSTADPDPIVSCPAGATFPLSAIDAIAPISEAPSGVENAMRTFLDDEEGAFWPQDGWQILHQTADRVLVVHVGDRSTAAAAGLSFMTLEAVDDTWVWAGASARADCPLQFQLDPGLGVVEWVLDPDQPNPGPKDTAVSLLATERACASGQPMDDRLSEPVVLADESQVSVTFSVVPLDGGQDCPGNPPTAIMVELGEALGERRLVDGRSVGVALEEILPPN